MTVPFRVTVEADEFARIMTNALAFFPARSQVNTAQLRFYPDRIVATGTDTYTMGRDSCEARNFQSSEAAEFPIEVELDRDGWKAIEQHARFDKKNTATLEFLPGDCLTFQPSGNEVKAEVATGKDATGTDLPFQDGEGNPLAVWPLCDELLERCNDRPTETPDVLCFDPALFGRFAKVKLGKSVESEKVLDFIWQGQAKPMLAKVGPSFVGFIMPINREKYADNQDDGDNSLWDN